MPVCTQCHTDKPFEDFHRMATSSTGYRSCCKACRSTNPKPHTLEEAFWRNVDQKDEHECWIWTGNVGTNTYGRLTFNKRTELAHRLSYMLHYGQIPEGYWVLHHCDVRICVNPWHLFIGTNLDNVHDAVHKRRHCHGINHPRTILSEQDVQEIRRLAGAVPSRILAKKYGVHRTTISYVQLRNTWKHVP